jgi:hypothetical protein
VSFHGIEDVLCAIADSVPVDSGTPEDGVVVQVTDFQVNLPLESRMDADGSLRVTLPRGMLATGFDPPLARIRASFERSTP